MLYHPVAKLIVKPWGTKYSQDVSDASWVMGKCNVIMIVIMASILKPVIHWPECLCMKFWGSLFLLSFVSQIFMDAINATFSLNYVNHQYGVSMIISHYINLEKTPCQLYHITSWLGVLGNSFKKTMSQVYM